MACVIHTSVELSDPIGQSVPKSLVSFPYVPLNPVFTMATMATDMLLLTVTPHVIPRKDIITKVCRVPYPTYVSYFLTLSSTHFSSYLYRMALQGLFFWVSPCWNEMITASVPVLFFMRHLKLSIELKQKIDTSSFSILWNTHV